MKIVYWSSSSRNTHKFIQKLDFESVEILPGNIPTLDEKYILVTPTFADGEGRGAVPKPVIRFLNIEQNRNNMLGVIGGGNRNFGEYFGIGAKVVSSKCNVPLLYLFELAGTDEDVTRVREGITKIWQ